MMRPRDEIMKGLECCDFEHWQSRKCKQCPYMKADDEWCDSADGVRGDAITYIQQLESQVPKWIGVAESLPEDDENVVVYTAERGVETAWFSGTNFWRLRTESLAWGIVPDVTHWMPMPEAPKEEEHEAD